MDRVVPGHEHAESGFTLIEVMIAAVILVTGLLSLAYAFGLGLGVIGTAQDDSIARQMARQAMEDVFTARDTGGIAFTAICNQPTAGCIFISGYEPLYTPGPDGIVNTSDDGTAAPLPGVVSTTGAAAGAILPPGCAAAPCIETIDTPGPDGILGTGDDIFVPLVGFQRQILITAINGTLDQVTVSIKFTTPKGITRTVTLVAFIGPYV
jgi:prepilin-type N-terminal cleavage/methylation domain-containing protein